jgi:hypothetical protein
MPLGMTDKTIPRKNIQYSSQLESGEGRLSDPWMPVDKENSFIQINFNDSGIVLFSYIKVKGGIRMNEPAFVSRSRIEILQDGLWISQGVSVTFDMLNCKKLIIT